MLLHRLAAVTVAVLATALLAPAQPAGVYSKAAPPDKAVLDRLNLKTEWVQNLPLEGTRDALEQVQTLGDQVFVQTRAGLLAALDARTGRIQWSTRLGNGSPGNAYPVAVNSQFVYCAHVTKLYAFYRYTGVAEFVTDLGSPPTTGLAADELAVYCVLGIRSGSAGAHRVAVYGLPRPIAVNEPVKRRLDALGQGASSTATSPVDDLVSRYHPGAYGAQPRVLPELTLRPKVLQAPVGGFTGSRSPSLATLPSVVPPYGLDSQSRSPSLNPLPSLQPPYHLRLESGRYIQQTPSVNTIPPSVSAALLLSDLRPQPVAPPLRWEYGLTARVRYPLSLTPTRVWAVVENDTRGDLVIALNKTKERDAVTIEASEALTSIVAAPPAATGLTFYVPLGNGTLLSVGADTGNVAGGLNVTWRTVVTGLNNHTPFVTKKFVYAAGDNSGVACVDRASGDIVWTSDEAADRVIGASEEFVYLRDRRGRLLVYDAARPTDAARRRSAPLGFASLPEFNVNVVNTASDRVYLAADNGLIVCVRDARAKYGKPVTIWPPAEINRVKRIAVDSKDPKTEVEPKKEP